MEALHFTGGLCDIFTAHFFCSPPGGGEAGRGGGEGGRGGGAGAPTHRQCAVSLYYGP